MQYVNNLTMITIIQKTHKLLSYIVYIIMIIYFNMLIKHLNVKEVISVIKTMLFNNCFNE